MFVKFISNNGLIYSFPAINEAMIVACINETGIDVVNDYVKEFILKVDVDNKKVFVKNMKGLLEWK